MEDPILLSKALSKLIPDFNFSYNSGHTYESIIFPEGKTVPPKEDIEQALLEAKDEILIEQLRSIRNFKLQESDFYMNTDFKFSSKEDRESILNYRQQLRDLPENVSSPNLNEYDEIDDSNFPELPNIKLKKLTQTQFDNESCNKTIIEDLIRRVEELETKLEQQESQSNSSNSIVEFIYSPQLSNKTKNEIDIVTQIIDSIIKTSNQSQPYTIFIGEADLSGNQVGFANWHTKQIGINTQHDYDRYYWTLNDIPYSFNTLVILHETLHILGILGVGDKWYGKDYLTNYQYTGPNGLAGYIKVLQENGYDVTDISCIPMEDDYSEGTKNVHFDEGIELVDGVYKEESKVINGVLHPIVTNEIMSGILNSHNYLTPITLGTLEDIGYEVDISSQFVSITGNNIKFIGSNETTESLIVDVSNNIIPENTKAYVKCNCNLVGHERNHQLFFIS